ncbi:MAG: SUMF1/EgtB/PvdO family nonheme iron enzyme, partial [Lentisphaerota bacterium]
TQADQLVRQACQATAQRLKTLPPQHVRACLQALSSLADAIAPTQARQVLLAAAGSGLDLEALCGRSGQDWCARLKSRLAPAGFEIVEEKPPALPEQKSGDPYGLVFENRNARELFLVMPRKIRAVKGLFSDSIRPVFLLVPGGQIYFPDDEGNTRTLRNEKPFYLAATETSWDALTSFYRGLSEAQRNNLVMDKSAINILANPSSRMLGAPASFARGSFISSFCAWLNSKRSSAGDQESLTLALNAAQGDKLDLATKEQWQFAACLDLLARAQQEKAQPSYEWWKSARIEAQWDAGTLRESASADPEGWGFCHLFGNVAELVRLSSNSAKMRRCGGSYMEASSSISSFPLYDREAREGLLDLGFRLVLLPGFDAEWAASKGDMP